jgi:hypothetical protein
MFLSTAARHKFTNYLEEKINVLPE